MLLAGATLSLIAACTDSNCESRAESERGPGIDRALADQPLEGFQVQLLELAIKAASAMPINPHIKSRSRSQAAVVATCLELEQPQRALSYLNGIENWLRGLMYADLALYCVQRGATAEAARYLASAQRIAEEYSREENAQAWRSDRIRMRIARAYTLLGELQRASELRSGVVDSEAGKVELARAMTVGATGFDERVQALDRILANGSFDQVRPALKACAQLFDRFYGEEERRAQMEQRVEKAYPKLPVRIRVELMMQLAEFALGHQGREHALGLVNRTWTIVQNARWAPEDEIALRAQLATLQHRCGDRAEARRAADATLAMFHSNHDRIVDIYRASALRPLAVAFHTIGDRATALAVCKLAVAEGVVNPNSRPRAEDLAATCCTLARHGIEPDAELAGRLARVLEDLGRPW